MDFSQLHNHTIFSANDSLCKPEHLAKRAAELKMPAVGMMDHGNMTGAPEFLKECLEVGVKPVFGVEVYVTTLPLISGYDAEGNSLSFKQDTGHLSLIAMNETGFRNLVKLCTISFRDYAYRGKPRLDIHDIINHKEGIIVLTGCMYSWFNLWITRHYWMHKDTSGIPEHAALLEEHDPYFYLNPSTVGLVKGAPYTDQFLTMARNNYTMLKAALGDQLYIELQEHYMPAQKLQRRFWAEYFPNEKTVATNDVHFIHQEDWLAQDFVKRIRWQGNGRSYFMQQLTLREDGKDGMAYFKNREDMEALKLPMAAIDNTMEIVERCNFELKKDKALFPSVRPATLETMKDFPTVVDYMRHLCLTSVRYPKDPEKIKKYNERIEHELKVMDEMGFPQYFIIVADILRYARENGATPGPGRGSVGGSLVAYLMHIHDAEPFDADLPFYRFLNPERISMPDIDIDFPATKRQKIINWIVEQYGDERVCAIGTAGSNKAKGCIQDWGRIADIDKPEIDAFNAKLDDMTTFAILKDDTEGVKLKEIRELLNKGRHVPHCCEPLTILEKVEGSIRSYGKHASGIVICGKPLFGEVPLFKSKKDEDMLATQYGMEDLEGLGFCKVDILGLKQMDVINNCLQDLGINREDIPLDDPDAIELLQSGNTVGIFQLGTYSYIKIIKDTRALDKKRKDPVTKEDIIDPEKSCLPTYIPFQVKGMKDLQALCALNRPGPKDYKDGLMIQLYAHRMTEGGAGTTYPHGACRPILQSTYGIMVYQEQVMQIARQLAGYNLAEADKLRKFVGKKLTENLSVEEKEKVVAPEREKFVKGCLSNHIAEVTARTIWDQIETFGRYGFNMCLTAGTKVCIMDPCDNILTKKIEDIKPGDMVPTLDTFGRLKWTIVEELYQNGSKKCVEVTFDEGSIVQCTADHKFMTTEGMLPLHEIVSRQIEVISVDGSEEWAPYGLPQQKRKMEELLRDDLPNSERMVSALSFMCDIPVMSHREPEEDPYYYQPVAGLAGNSFPNRNHNIYEGGHQIPTCLTPIKLAHGEPGEIPGDNREGTEGPSGRQLSEPDGEVHSQGTTGSGTPSSSATRIVQEISRLCREVYDSGIMVGDGRTPSFLSSPRRQVTTTGTGTRSELNGSCPGPACLSDKSLNEDVPPIRSQKNATSMAHNLGYPGYTKAEWRVLPRRIILVRPMGIEPTYDIQVADPTHRFLLANGIITSNSHAYFYAMIAMWGAYLKAHYPTTFLGACLKYEEKNSERERMIDNAKQMSIYVKSPDINRSEACVSWKERTVSIKIKDKVREYQGTIFLGLSDIRSVNENTAHVLIGARGNQPFTSMVDMVMRIKKYCEDTGEKMLDKGSMARLAWANVFESLVPSTRPRGKREWACSVLTSDALPEKYRHKADRQNPLTKSGKPRKLVDYVEDYFNRHKDIWVRLYDLGYNFNKKGLLAAMRANMTNEKQIDLEDLVTKWDAVIVEQDRELLAGTEQLLSGSGKPRVHLATRYIIKEDVKDITAIIHDNRHDWEASSRVTIAGVVGGRYSIRKSASGQNYIKFDLIDDTGFVECSYNDRATSNNARVMQHVQRDKLGNPIDEKYNNICRVVKPGAGIALTGWMRNSFFAIFSVEKLRPRLNSTVEEEEDAYSECEEDPGDTEGESAA